MNIDLAHHVISTLTSQGVSDFVVCAGSYNSPLVYLLQKAENLYLDYHFDERGAAFFALGRIKRDGRPVAVVTTSGTAVAECLPAVVEAYFSELPLIIVSADRPVRFFETGAPQVVNQAEMLDSHTKASYDLDDINTFEISYLGPSHINVRFEEPLFDKEISDPVKFSVREVIRKESVSNSGKEINELLRDTKSPVILVGELKKSEQKIVVNFLSEFKAPIFAESLSGISGNHEIKECLIESGEEALLKYPFDSVIRIGNVPTASFWRDLSRKDSFKNKKILSFSSQSFSGTDRVHPQFRISELSNVIPDKSFFDKEAKEFLEKDKKWRSKIDSLILELPNSEVGMLANLSKLISNDSKIYLGNSLPIREWGLIDNSDNKREYFANRGVNGIDGQIATFAGLLSEKETWGVIGDLTALYDTTSLSLLAQSNFPYRLVVINNEGGKIFSRLPQFNYRFPNELGEKFVNKHSISVASIGEAFGISSMRVDNINTKNFPFDKKIIEIYPSASQSEQFWAEYSAIFTSGI